MSPVSPGGTTSIIFLGVHALDSNHIYYASAFEVEPPIHSVGSFWEYELLGNHQNVSKRYSHLGVVNISPFPGRVATIR